MSEVTFSSVGLKSGGGAKLTPNLFARDKDFLGRRGLVGFRHMQWTVESALFIGSEQETKAVATPHRSCCCVGWLVRSDR